MAAIRRLILCFIYTTAGLLSVSGTEINSKYVCLGDSFQAFQDIVFDQCSGFVSLTRRSKQIAIWSFQNCVQNTTVVNEYEDRVFLHQNGTITIHNITKFDLGQYIVNAKTGLLSDIHEVNVYVPVAPSKTCKPIINQWRNKLHAGLRSEECGRPIVTTYWKGDDGVSDTHDQLLQIAEGNTAHIYTACIEGPALQCAKNVTPIATCSSYVINGSNIVSTVHEAHNDRDIHILYNALFVPVLVLFIAATVLQTFRYRRSKKECNSSVPTLGHRKPSGGHYDIICLEPFKVKKESNRSVPTLEYQKPSGEQYDIICLEELKVTKKECNSSIPTLVHWEPSDKQCDAIIPYGFEECNSPEPTLAKRKLSGEQDEISFLESCKEMDQINDCTTIVIEENSDSAYNTISKDNPKAVLLTKI